MEGFARRRGFTLVELLVVIGIIALLVAILMPTLRKAREQANAIRCSSNQRQILLAMMMYANENRGILPVPGLATPGGSSGQMPVQAIRFDYVPFVSCSLLWKDGEGTLWPYIGVKDPGDRERLFACPTEPDPRYTRATDGARQYPIARNFSYAFNEELDEACTYNPQTGPNSGPAVGVRFSRIIGVEHKILLAETDLAWGPGYFFATLYSRQPIALGNPLPRRHSNRAFVGMADGHVELFEPENLTNPMRGVTYNFGNFSVKPQYQYYFMLPH